MSVRLLPLFWSTAFHLLYKNTNHHLPSFILLRLIIIFFTLLVVYLLHPQCLLIASSFIQWLLLVSFLDILQVSKATNYMTLKPSKFLSIEMLYSMRMSSLFTPFMVLHPYFPDMVLHNVIVTFSLDPPSSSILQPSVYVPSMHSTRSSPPHSYLHDYRCNLIANNSSAPFISTSYPIQIMSLMIIYSLPIRNLPWIFPSSYKISIVENWNQWKDKCSKSKPYLIFCSITKWKAYTRL